MFTSTISAVASTEATTVDQEQWAVADYESYNNDDTLHTRISKLLQNTSIRTIKQLWECYNLYKDYICCLKRK